MMHSSDLKQLLLEYGKLSVGQLQMLTSEDSNDLQFLIDQWIQKGRITIAKDEESACGGGCSGCGVSSDCGPPTYYSWITKQ